MSFLESGLTVETKVKPDSRKDTEELIAMTKQFNEAARRGEEVNLNDAELAFYDALKTNEASVREFGVDLVLQQAEVLSEAWVS